MCLRSLFSRCTALRRAVVCAGFVLSFAVDAQAEVPAPAAVGFGVVALEGAGDAAWPLAQALYAKPALRPALDEPTARVLAGEPPPPDAPASQAEALRDLSQTRAALKGDDAPTRTLLDGMARTLAVEGFVVVSQGAEGPLARVYLARLHAYDAARYAPDPQAGGASAAPPRGGVLTWNSTVASLERAYARPSASMPPRANASASTSATASTPAAPVLSPDKPADVPTSPKPFYASPWLWGALGAAALFAGVFYVTTRDTGTDAIHLHVQVPQ